MDLLQTCCGLATGEVANLLRTYYGETGVVDYGLYVPSPLHTFPCNFPVDGEVDNFLPTCWHQVVVMEFAKRRDTTDTTDFCPCQLVTDLLRTCRLCCGLVKDLLGRNWCNGFWSLASARTTSCTKQALITQIRMYYRSGTVRRYCVWSGMGFMFTHQVAALFCLKWRVAAILKVWRQIEIWTPSIDAYLLEEHFCQILSRSHWNDGDLSIFKDCHRKATRTITTTTRWVAIWDQFLI